MNKYLNWPVFISVLLVLVPLATTSILSIYFVKNESLYGSFSDSEWISFSLLGILSQAFALTPPTFCAMVLGYFWGWKTLPLLFGINLASIYLINWIVRRIDHNKFITFIERNPKAKTLLNSIKNDELKIITLTKLSPVLPFTFTNFIFALSGARIRNILLGGFLGMIPRTLISLWTGTQAKEIRNLLENPNEGNIQKIALIALVLISIIGLFLVIGKSLRRVS